MHFFLVTVDIAMLFSSSVSRITVPYKLCKQNKKKQKKNFCDTVGEYNVKNLIEI